VIVFGTFLSATGFLIFATLRLDTFLILFVLNTSKIKLITTKTKMINVIL